MYKSLVALLLASLATCAQANTSANKYYVLDSSGSYPVIVEVTKEQACAHKAKPMVGDYKPPVLSLIKDECSNGKIHPNAVVLIQEKKLPLALATEKQ